jgi:hypothetical protein
MNISEIVKDALRYPFSDLKKFLILGLILLMGTLLVHYAHFFGYLTYIILLLGFLIQIMEYGYCFRIITASLNGLMEPPEFNAWKDMFFDGIKMLIVLFVYLIPAFLIIFLTGIFSTLSSGIYIAILYIIIILPIIAIEVVQMADSNIEHKGMFKFHEILDKIYILGWKKFIKWYLTTGIIFLIIFILGISAVTITERVTFSIIGTILLYLLIIPYLSMYLTRSIALIFKTK